MEGDNCEKEITANEDNEEGNEEEKQRKTEVLVGVGVLVVGRLFIGVKMLCLKVWVMTWNGERGGVAGGGRWG